jgi:hypothetical protein
MNPLRHFGRTPWIGDRPIARPLTTEDSETKENAGSINASSGIRAHNLSVREAQIYKMLKLRGHWGRQCDKYK